MENQKVIVVGDPNIAKAHILAELASRGIHDFDLVIEPKDVTPEMVHNLDLPTTMVSPFAREPMVLHAPQMHYLNDGSNHPPIEQYRRNTPKVSRNALCPCGCGRKSKRCCNK